MDKQLIAQLAVVFLLTQCLGMFVGDYLLGEGIRTTIVSDNPEGIENSIGMVAWILFFTAILIGMLRFAPKWLLDVFLKGIESLAIFGTTILVLMPFGIGISSGFIAICLVAVRLIFRENILLRNVSSVVAAAGAGALIGASLGVIPVLLFMVLLSVYDFVAVFKTKHMVELAKGVSKKNLSFTYALPTKKRKFELGTGDMVIPLAFAVSVLGTQVLEGAWRFVPSSMILLASFIGLVYTLHFASLKEGRALPALPLQTGLMIVVFGIFSLFGI